MGKGKPKAANIIGGGILGLITATAAYVGINYFVDKHNHEEQMAKAQALGSLKADKKIGTFSPNQASMVAGLQATGVDPELAKAFSTAYHVASSDPKEKGNMGISYLAVKKGPAEMWAQVMHNPVTGGPSNMLQSTLCYSLNGVVKNEFKSLPVDNKFVAVEAQSFIKGGCDKRLTFAEGKYKINKITMSQS